MRKRFETAWAIRPEAVASVARIMTAQLASTGTPGQEASAAGWHAATPSVRSCTAGKIALVPIQGILTPDGPAAYGSNYQGITDAVAKAAANPDVKTIVLSVDSPGGQVTGLPECAAVIAATAKVKPVRAIVEGAARIGRLLAYVAGVRHHCHPLGRGRQRGRPHDARRP